MEKALASASKTILAIVALNLTRAKEIAVTVEELKVAVSLGRFGTTAGVQLAAVVQSPEVGLRFQVALSP